MNDFQTALKNAVLSAFIDLAVGGNKAAEAAVAIGERLEFAFGFLRSSNTTDHKSAVDALRGTAMKRVSLDRTSAGSTVVLINRTLCETAAAAFIAAVHGLILAWRDAEVPTVAGTKRMLLDKEFHSLANAIGLTRVADTRTVVKDGKESVVKISESNARVWFGASDNLARLAEAFANECPTMPEPFVGTEASTAIGTTIIPCKVQTPDGWLSGFMMRFSSFTASEKRVASGDDPENATLVAFRAATANSNIALDTKNKGYKLLSSLCKEDDERKAAAAAAAAAAKAAITDAEVSQAVDIVLSKGKARRKAS